MFDHVSTKIIWDRPSFERLWSCPVIYKQLKALKIISWNWWKKPIYAWEIYALFPVQAGERTEKGYLDN